MQDLRPKALTNRFQRSITPHVRRTRRSRRRRGSEKSAKRIAREVAAARLKKPWSSMTADQILADIATLC